LKRLTPRRRQAQPITFPALAALDAIMPLESEINRMPIELANWSLASSSKFV